MNNQVYDRTVASEAQANATDVIVQTVARASRTEDLSAVPKGQLVEALLEIEGQGVTRQDPADIHIRAQIARDTDKERYDLLNDRFPAPAPDYD